MRNNEKGSPYQRSAVYMNRYTQRRTRPQKGSMYLNKGTFNRIANQFIVSAGIVLLIIILSNFKGLIPGKLVGGAKWVVGNDFNFKTAAVTIWNGLKSGVEKTFNTDSSVPDNSSDTTNEDETDASTVYSSMIMPVNGKITSEFGTRESPITHKTEEHDGIDIDGEKGTPIKAVLDGIVKNVSEDDNLGRYVTLEHEGGIETVYGHCSEILVNINDTVKKGDYIAKIGDTGLVTGPHLHFKVLKDGVPINPLDMIGSTAEPN